jgi:thioredoxin-like negative regulator of GroEL
MRNKKLDEAIALVRAGKNAEAQPLLQSLIGEDPGNIAAWLWAAATWPTTAEKLRVLEACKKRNPGSPQVNDALARLKVQLAVDVEAAIYPPGPALDAAQAAAKGDIVMKMCPNCGGQLAVATNALSLKCPHCGALQTIL